MKINLAPFYDYGPTLKDPQTIGKGIKHLNRYMSARLANQPDKWNEELYEFLKLHNLHGVQLLLDGGIIRDIKELEAGLEDALDYLLEPAGLTWEEFKKVGHLKGEMDYHKYLERGFSTPTGKVELYSTVLEKWGFDPLPTYTEIPESPISQPELAEKYPYILNAGLRTPTFFHSANFMVPWLREIRPDPIVEIHPETAHRHGIENGQWIHIESPRGRIKQRAKLNAGINPKVIVAEHGWWFPEIKDSGHGWDVSNVNILTDNAYETLDPAIGATNLRVCLCNIAPA